MAGADRQIDDEYCEKMNKYIAETSLRIENYLNAYLVVLDNIKKNAIISGEVSDSLTNYIIYAKNTKGKVNEIAEVTQKHIFTFLERIDLADQYLF